MAAGSNQGQSQAEERFKRKLVEVGLLSDIKTPKVNLEVDRTPIRVKGKPLSETIIEERR